MKNSNIVKSTTTSDRKKMFERSRKKNNSIKELTEKELIYLAAFIDANGSINGKIVRDDTRYFKFALRIEINITQHKRHRWFLTRIATAIPGMQAGHLLDKSLSKNTVDVDRIYINSLYHAGNFLSLLKPYLILKRKQAGIALEIIRRYYRKTKTMTVEEFLELAHLIDRISVENNSFERKKITYVTVLEELVAKGIVNAPYQQ